MSLLVVVVVVAVAVAVLLAVRVCFLSYYAKSLSTSAMKKIFVCLM